MKAIQDMQQELAYLLFTLVEIGLAIAAVVGVVYIIVLVWKVSLGEYRLPKRRRPMARRVKR